MVNEVKPTLIGRKAGRAEVVWQSLKYLERRPWGGEYTSSFDIRDN
jgi:hypothetical protein